MQTVVAAHKEGKSILVLLDNHKVLLLADELDNKDREDREDREDGEGNQERTAIEINPSWSIFSIDGDINQVIESIKRKGNQEILELVKNNKNYQDQINNYFKLNLSFKTKAKARRNVQPKTKEAIISQLFEVIHKRDIKASDVNRVLKEPQGISSLNTEEILEVRDSNQRHLIHHLAVKGLLYLTPKRLLTSKALLERDKNLISALEYHYFNHPIKDIPKEVWEVSEISENDSYKAEILSWASKLKKASELPKMFFSEGVLKHIVEESQITPLHQLARDGQLLVLYNSHTSSPISNKTKDLLNMDILQTKDMKGKSVYHALAEFSNLKDLKELGYKNIPSEILDLKDDKNLSVAHTIIYHGGLEHIGQDYWTDQRWEQLTLTTGYPLHLAAKNGELKYLPQKRISTQELLKLDNQGQNAYQHAIESEKLHMIDAKLLSNEALLSPCSSGVSSITKLVNKCIGWGKKPLPKSISQDVCYALKFLNVKELKKLEGSGITKVSLLCANEINNRILRKLSQSSNSIEI